MSPQFDPGYTQPIYQSLVDDCPGVDVFPIDAFRVEWGPIFHRGRLDGSARILVIGQDPATHEAMCRRILVGEAGQRVQGFLSKLGVTTSYVMINAFAYSVFGQQGGEDHVNDAGIVAYRNRWLDALTGENPFEAIVSLGHLADDSYTSWKVTPVGLACGAAYATMMHPTYPDSASRSRRITKAAAMARLCESWNAALTLLHPVVTPDDARPLVPYGDTIDDTDLTPIPAVDLPAGLPPWMRSLKTWAVRPSRGITAETKRATINVTIPTGNRIWPPIPDLT